MLKKILKDADITYDDLIEALNIKSKSTISLKINGKAKVYTDEAFIIRDLIYKKTKKKYNIEELFK